MISPLAQVSDHHYFPDIPENHWAYQTMADFQSVGLLVGNTVGFFSGPPRTRPEMAVITQTIFTNLHMAVTEVDQENRGLAQTSKGQLSELYALRRSLKSTIDSYENIRPQMDHGLHRLITIFSPELRLLGVDVKDMTGETTRDLGYLASFRLAEVGAALKQFSDVPTNHWAAQATKDLRAIGILDGYPSAKYRG